MQNIMQDAYFFGYGSLVNRKTHAFQDAQPAIIRGWRREWRRSHAYGRTFLSVVRDPDARIGGLIARVPKGDWETLDKREAGYSRHDIAPTDIMTQHVARPQIYAIAPEAPALPCERFPIRLSYLDVVIAGFLQEFGPEGVTDFFKSTTGWGIVADDRARPLYARALPVGQEIEALVDEHLAAHAVARCERMES